MGEKKNDSEVSVARINAKSAIAVAFITTISGLLTFVATKFFDSSRKFTQIECNAIVQSIFENIPQQRWIKVVGISDGGLSSQGFYFRLKINVDNVMFSYPNKTAWAEVGPVLTPAAYPIPIGNPNNKLSFEVEAIDDQQRVVNFTSNEVIDIEGVENQTISYKMLNNRVTKLGAVRAATAAGGNLRTLTVDFEIFEDRGSIGKPPTC